MSRVFDTPLASSDLSLDRVLNAGLPAALVFYEKELRGNMRQTLDDLARQYAGKLLIVTLARSDAAQAMSRFQIRQLPSLIAVQDGKAIARQENLQIGELKPYLAYLAGEGPLPSMRAAASGPSVKRETDGSPLHVNEASFEREVLRSDRPVLIDFWASWCAPCRMVEPTLEKLAREQIALKVVKVNVDENPSLASHYRAMSIPMMIVIKGGQEVDRWVGALPEQAIRSRVARWIQGQPQAT
jgi:thioredoxin 1